MRVLYSFLVSFSFVFLMYPLKCSYTGTFFTSSYVLSNKTRNKRHFCFESFPFFSSFFSSFPPSHALRNKEQKFFKNNSFLLSFNLNKQKSRKSNFSYFFLPSFSFVLSLPPPFFPSFPSCAFSSAADNTANNDIFRKDNLNKEEEKVQRSVIRMSWICSGRTNADLVSNLKKNGIIRNERVYSTMLKVDRGDFVSDSPYADSPQPVGYGATISAPHMHAYALEYLKENLKKGKKALDVGSGSGYLTACFAYMVDVLNTEKEIDGENAAGAGEVIGIDCIEELVEMSIKNVSRNNKALLECPNFKLIKGDGWKGIEGKKFDVIHVGAAAAHIPPALLEQLNNNGKMIIPVGEPGGFASLLGGGGGQKLVLVSKDEEGNVKQDNLFGVAYVPLVQCDEQKKKF